MATFYLDPIGGNDANDGTTFANRWQSLTSGALAARTAPGDTIRVIQSPAPTSLGQNATWTDGSRTVTLTSAVTIPIHAATSAWTAVTNSSSTTSTNRKFGSTSTSLSVAAGFTTGKSHYATTPGGNYTAYEQITFWIMQTAGTLASADGEISLRLCSDTTGDTVLHTFNIPRICALNVWQAFTINKGSSITGTIQSVAFYINTDRGAQTFLINNIEAVKAASAADSLSLTSLISKNSGTEGWFAIDSISSNSVVLRTGGTSYNLSNAGAVPTYAGTTATVTTWKREPLNLPSLITADSNGASPFGIVNESGTSGSPITYSGGWNSTDMSTQTGDTYISGVNGLGYAIANYGYSFVNFDKINLVNFRIGVYTSGALSNFNITAKDISFNNYANFYLENASAATEGPVNCSYTIDNVLCAGSSAGKGIEIYRSAKNIRFDIINLNSNWSQGFFSSGDGGVSNPWMISKIKLNATNCRRNYTGIYSFSLTQSTFTFATVTNNTTEQLLFSQKLGSTLYAGVIENTFKITSAVGSSSGIVIIYGFESTVNNTFDLTGATVSNGSVGVLFGKGSSGNKIIGGTFSSNTGQDISIDGGLLTCIGTTLSSTTPYSIWEPGVSQIKFQKYGNVANDHRHYYEYGSVLTDTTIRKTATGISWKISPTSTKYVTEDFPMVLPVGRVAVNASSLVTAKVWVYRTNTAITAKLVCKGGQIAGVSSDVVDTANGSASTWEELSITFTPSEDGVIDLEVQVFGGTTHSVYVDDLSVIQA